ncbi:hypothetical protein [Thalassotalea crassostreae]|uniref:hypothetical protein n=1 Tax=Thalassotalea crassostreae TaxID=1763536 RepID=UPI00083968F7|nr:hypothetical protein [Thalassotalea crassostreae]
MSNHHVGEYNRSLTEGTPFQNEISIALRFALLCLNIKNKNQRNVRDQIVVLMLCWLKNNFSWVEGKEKVPTIIRTSDANLLDKDHQNTWYIRTVGDHHSGWVEYSHTSNVRDIACHVWLVVPHKLNHFLWAVIKEKEYESSLFKNACNELVSNFEKYKKTKKGMFAHAIATFHQFANYLHTFLIKDELALKLAKNAQIAQDKLPNHMSGYYNNIETDSLRYILFHAFDRALTRISNALVSWELIDKLQIDIAENSHNQLSKTIAIIDPTYDMPPRLAECISVIPEFVQGKYVKKAGTIAPRTIGADFVPNESQIGLFMDALFEKVIHLRKLPNTIENLCELHNTLTFSLACYTLILTGIRPSHAIGPDQTFVNKHGFCIKDKGKARLIILCNFLAEQFAEYEEHFKHISSIFPELRNQNAIFCTIESSGEVTPICASNIKKFVSGINPKLAPKHFRKAFSSLMVTLTHCSSTHLNHHMGHGNYGEQDGLKLTLNATNRKQQKYLNELADQLSPACLFTEAK